MKVCPHCRTQYGPEVTVCPNDGARLDGDDAPHTDALIGQILADRYRIIRTLGEGGMGRVYLGEHVRMGRPSAIKVMHPAMAPTADAIGRFNREAANASRINHPHVAAIYDFGETADGTLYLAMEYVDGENLAQLLAREGPLPAQRVAALTTQVADALAAAHKLGIVHRDLKPDNILITRDDAGNEFAKVVDFGIAKSMRTAGQTVTTAGISIGTPAFMSPEQLAGGELDHRSDIYSLGLVVYSMLAGTLPYADPSSKEALVERLTARPRPLAQMIPTRKWQPQLQAALDRAVSPDVGDRYDKVGDFARDLTAAAAAPADDASTRRMTPIVTKRIDQVTSPAAPVAAPVAAPASPAMGRRTPVFVGVLALIAGAVFLFARNHSSPIVTADTSRAVGGTATHLSAATTAASTPAAPSAVDSSRATSTNPPSPPSSNRDSAPHPKKTVAASAPAKALAGTAPSPKSFVAPVRADSEMPIPAPPADPAARRAGRHTWLRASGDSAPRALSAPSPVAAEAREVMGHLNRARKFFSAQQPARGLPELRWAYEEYGIFAADHPDIPETRVLGQQLRATLAQVLSACRAASDTASPAAKQNLPCDNIERAARSSLRNGPGGDGAARGGRRMKRPDPSP